MRVKVRPFSGGATGLCPARYLVVDLDAEGGGRFVCALDLTRSAGGSNVLKFEKSSTGRTMGPDAAGLNSTAARVGCRS